MSAQLQVEVVYALPGTQTLVAIKVRRGTTVAQAVVLSGIQAKHPEIDVASSKLGIFGKLAAPDTVLRDGDRVEIYRPLIADVKEARRKRALQGGKPKT